MLFTYKAVDRDGAMVTGTCNAADKSQVIAHIKAQRMMPVDISNGQTTSLLEMLPKKKTPVGDMSMFCEQFCALLRAGVTIIDALTLLHDQTKDKALAGAIQETIVGVTAGESLGVAMARSPKVFNETLVSLVKAGEASGSLDASLERMADQFKKEAEILAAVKKAMIYPIVVCVVALAVVVFMLLFIVPRFMAMFSDVGIEMPKITLMVVAASEWLAKNYLLAGAILIVTIVAIVSFFKSKKGKEMTSKAVLKIPVIKEFVKKSNASKIARTLSTLLTAGMPIVEAFAILESTLSNYCYKEAIREVRETVIAGQPMANKFIENKELFPPMLTHMIAVGEDTGDTTAMLVRTADYYDLEVETAIDTMMSLMQPAIILLLVGIVSIVLAAVLAPMVALYSQLGDAL